MVEIITELKANLDADKVYLNKLYLRDPPHHRFRLSILNGSSVEYWFKLYKTAAEWALGSDLPGNSELELGSIGAAGTAIHEIDMVRTASPGIPVGETEESATLTLKVYSDSGYLTEVGSDDLAATLYIEDTENWTNVEKFDFEDGSAQGWSLTNMAVANDKSIEPSGYSIAGKNAIQNTTLDCYCSKTISFPNTNKVRVSFFYVAWVYTPASGPQTWARVKDLRAEINDIERWVSRCYFSISAAGAVAYGWYSCMLDASALKGQSLSLKLLFQLITGDWSGNKAYLYIDRIVIAGKN